ncbi:Threonine dehydratase [Entamoeba marina]
MVDIEVPALALRDASFSEIHLDTDDEDIEQIFLSDVYAAKHTLSDHIHHTPLDSNASISADLGIDVFMKHENMQKTGSFKVRGVYNKFTSLTLAEQKRGVITASCGNHGMAVAYCGKKLGVPVTIVLPNYTPPRRVETIRRYGSVAIMEGSTLAEAETYAKDLAKEKKINLPEVDAIITPIGSGSLLCGVALAVKTLDPHVKIYGVQSEKGSAAYLSKKHHTLCRTHGNEDNELVDVVNTIGKLTLGMIEKFVDDIVVVKETEITKAMMLLMERCKVITEGAGAVAFAGLLSGALPIEKGSKVAILISGGNVDMRVLNNVIDLGLIGCERNLKLKVVSPDSPINLNEIVDIVAEQKAQMYDLQVKRNRSIGMCTVVLSVEVGGREHKQQLATALEERGYEINFV